MAIPFKFELDEVDFLTLADVIDTLRQSIPKLEFLSPSKRKEAVPD